MIAAVTSACGVGVPASRGELLLTMEELSEGMAERWLMVSDDDNRGADR